MLQIDRFCLENTDGRLSGFLGGPVRVQHMTAKDFDCTASACTDHAQRACCCMPFFRAALARSDKLEMQMDPAKCDVERVRRNLAVALSVAAFLRGQMP